MIEAVFGEVLVYLVETVHVKLEHYFVAGTKIEVDANKHVVGYYSTNLTNCLTRRAAPGI